MKPEQTLGQLGPIYTDLQNVVTKADFQAAVAELVKFLKGIDQRTLADVGLVKQTFEQAVSKLQADHGSSLDTLKGEVDKLFVGSRIQKMEQEHQGRMQAVDSTLAKVKNGEQGPQGVKGDRGERGPAGSPDTPLKVRNKLESLTGEERLDKSAIKGLDEEIAQLKQGGSRTGWGAHPLTVQSSGTVVGKVVRNINFSGGLTATANASGVITVIATGTGYQAPTSGTVNGSNTVFVFTTAPNAVIVDGGRAIQKVSGDGKIGRAHV